MKKEHWVILTVLLLAIASIAFLILKRPLRFDHLTDDTASDTTVSDVTNTLHSDGREAKLVSAFFGLDNALPNALNQFIHREMGGKDGMPVVFSHELDVDSLQAGDFEVNTASGKLGRIVCVTLAPALSRCRGSAPIGLVSGRPCHRSAGGLESGDVCGSDSAREVSLNERE
ncbi:MAG: hypothetical protein ACPGFB_05365 [Verrucomicrobiales bacterium]